MKYDYLIIGQGLSGTFLSWNLIKAGQSVMVIDEDRPDTATKVASGIINPVTGRRIVRTWRIEELLPFARKAYKVFGEELGVDLVTSCNILDFHPSLQMKDAFNKRLNEGKEYLKRASNKEEWEEYFRFHFGVGEIDQCLLIDLHALLHKWRRKLKLNNCLLEERFDLNNCDLQAEQVGYKGLSASKIIFCDGVDGFNNPYFKNLPYSRMKGEVLIVDIKNLPRNNIYKQGISLVPWKDDLFWVGSSYEWQFQNLEPTNAFRRKVEEQLKYFLKVPFTIVSHLASERPANLERRPFVGFHPNYPNIGIFNGMGTKGCSVAPFFARQLAESLTGGSSLYPDVDVARFKKVLSRE